MALERLPRRVAVDTGALLALAHPRDQYHGRARTTVQRLQAQGCRLVGHALILGELHGHLLHRIGSRAAHTIVGEIGRASCRERV